jgi:AcrR family transcriptional regulator
LTEAVPSAPAANGWRRERTRRRLTEAASALIAEKGVAGLRIQEITERADVALGSFYNHFATKQELVEAVVASTIGVRAAAIVAQMTVLEDPAEVVSFACRRVVRLAFEEPELAWLFVNLDRADALFETIVHRSALAALEDGIRSGRFGVENADVALITIIGGALAVMRAILDGRCGDDVDSLFAESVLRSVGLGRDEAAALARVPLEAPQLS